MKWIRPGLFSLLFLLAGCSNMNAGFDCPIQPGVHCESLDSVNAKVDRGEMGRDGAGTAPPCRLNQSPGWTGCHRPARDTAPVPLAKASPAWPRRTGERVQRIWIAAFEDIAGHYHMASDVFVVAAPAHWSVQTARTGQGRPTEKGHLK